MPGSAKPLRFVTSYGAPYPKRRRIAAACLTCRKRKTACSGEKPHCKTCKQNGTDCAGYAGEVREPRRASPSQDAVNVTPTLHTKDTRPPPTRARSIPDAPIISSPRRRSLFPGPRNRMPYFRWLGPTAIMPGFKQMVVKIKQRDTNEDGSSAEGGSLAKPPLSHSSSTAAFDPGSLRLPFYDNSPAPSSELIIHLTHTFFAHLGCNFPFLPRERFLRDVREKHVDPILVDAVCALAARFSTHPLLISQASPADAKLSAAEYGQAFAQRAKVGLIDTFVLPTIAAAQAALLLAYNEFGESRDSGLWMYLGIAIRLAEDLGLHKLGGLRYRGITGPTPHSIKQQIDRATSGMPVESMTSDRPHVETKDDGDSKCQMAGEQERLDTFWAIFFLDKAVSSGTGRRSTLRDKDIEISFPPHDSCSPDGWPAPFPALIRIIHLYGRVADLLNGIKTMSDITGAVPERLAAMEAQVTTFYQGLSRQLHFDAINFQHYVKAGEGTNFVLLHFWFHTLIILLHQPTLLKTFEGTLLQLFPNSQQLSMSSAKTIADILNYSQLIDAKACLGNPFTTQPIYVAACAFLRETAEHTSTENAQSCMALPTAHQELSTSVRLDDSSKDTPTQHARAKHTLLATAANQHYQLCYRALQSLETYWAGTKYILTVLDQKFQGVRDPVLYTAEEGACAVERPTGDPAYTTPGWRRNLRLATSISSDEPEDLFSDDLQAVRRGNASAKAIGWAIAGSMDSASTSFAFHYPRTVEEHSLLAAPESAQRGGNAQVPDRLNADASAVSDASLLLGLHMPIGSSTALAENAPRIAFGRQDMADQAMFDTCTATHGTTAPDGMFIEIQNVDMSMLGLEMMPWFDPTFGNVQDDLSLFDMRLADGHAALQDVAGYQFYSSDQRPQ